MQWRQITGGVSRNSIVPRYYVLTWVVWTKPASVLTAFNPTISACQWLPTAYVDLQLLFILSGKKKWRSYYEVENENAIAIWLYERLSVECDVINMYIGFIDKFGFHYAFLHWWSSPEFTACRTIVWSSSYQRSIWSTDFKSRSMTLTLYVVECHLPSKYHSICLFALLRINMTWKQINFIASFASSDYL